MLKSSSYQRLSYGQGPLTQQIFYMACFVHVSVLCYKLHQNRRVIGARGLCGWVCGVFVVMLSKLNHFHSQRSVGRLQKLLREIVRRLSLVDAALS